ncbi:MAG: hypothetical protein QHC77_14780 [Stenotrophomonas sp.]|jgi:hypothetical protein|uniref:hypothetical protein n=1 Tax=unclassified Stenotrophomonas TaxID=196198 RepID=UPI0029AE552C|nr:hypothetical protein [Stenotrophomonas sp.]MDX3933197.1 hypothetical protein [Stenotrophomonas sp.]
MNVIVQRASPLPIVAFLMAIAGWTLLPVIGSIIALICAGQARREAAHRADLADDGGLLKAAQVLGWSAIGVALLVVAALLVLLRVSAHQVA